MSAVRPSSLLLKLHTHFPTLIFWPSLKSSSFRFHRISFSRRFSIGCRFLASAAGGTGAAAAGGTGAAATGGTGVAATRGTGVDSSRKEGPSLEFQFNTFPIPGLEDVLLDFINGGRKATEVAHSIWSKIIRRGDTVVDATCGNGYDVAALLRLTADDSLRGCVYGLDIQKSALESTSYLLRECVVEEQRDLVKLFLLCHSRMEDVIPNDTLVRLVAFNLGYLPGGDKAIITKPGTTVLALQAACRILASGGLISIVVYVGHPGGREEYGSILSFTSSLPADGWNCFKFETVNRPSGPVLVFIFKK